MLMRAAELAREINEKREFEPIQRLVRNSFDAEVLRDDAAQRAGIILRLVVLLESVSDAAVIPELRQKLTVVRGIYANEHPSTRKRLSNTNCV